MLLHDRHIKFAARFMKLLPAQLQGQDATRVVIAYFAVGSLDLLGKIDSYEKIYDYLHSLKKPVDSALYRH